MTTHSCSCTHCDPEASVLSTVEVIGRRVIINGTPVHTSLEAGPPKVECWPGGGLSFVTVTLIADRVTLQDDLPTDRALVNQ